MKKKIGIKSNRINQLINFIFKTILCLVTMRVILNNTIGTTIIKNFLVVKPNIVIKPQFTRYFNIKIQRPKSESKFSLIFKSFIFTAGVIFYNLKIFLRYKLIFKFKVLWNFIYNRYYFSIWKRKIWKKST